MLLGLLVPALDFGPVSFQLKVHLDFGNSINPCILYGCHLLECCWLCLDFFSGRSSPLSPQSSGELSVLEMPQCISLHRGLSSHQNFPFTSTTYKKSPESSIWSVHFFIYPALPHTMGEVPSPDPACLIEPQIDTE